MLGRLRTRILDLFHAVRAVDASRRNFGLIVLAAWLATIVVWREFWFLTDDAHIAFRYVSNHQAGWGYVWNPPPFRPVEGYTSFAWVVLLDWTWTLTGLEPPESANWLSLAFSLGTITLVAATLRRGLPGPNGNLWIVLACLGTVTNRSFAAWTSSGLETAMYVFWTAWWMYEAVGLTRSGADRRPTVLRFAAAAALAALTRPDALVFVGATVAVFGVWLLRGVARRGSGRGERRLGMLGMLGIAVVVLPIVMHLLWRWHFYGAWLPNTYYAKVAKAWPSAGRRFLLSFILEYALWIWGMVLAAALGFRAWRRTPIALPVLAVSAALGFQVAYYTLRVGGDHFEYKAWAHIVPWLYVAFAWALHELTARRPVILLAFSIFLSVGWVLPWTHYALSLERTTRKETGKMFVETAPVLPAFLGPYAGRFDETQAWLIDHFICMRHQEHKVFYEHLRERLPSREEGAKIVGDDIPVHWTGEAGVRAWTLPNVAILDAFGLNDWVIARNPIRRPVRMAHDRHAPTGYKAAFRPNVRLVKGKWKLEARRVPLLDEDVRRIENEYAARAHAG